MKLSDAVKLGHANIKAQKRRSVMMIVVIGVAFSLVFMVNFILQGLREDLTRIVSQPTDGKVLLLTSTIDWGCYMGLETCERDEGRIPEIEAEVTRLGGTVIGEMPIVNGMWLGLPEEVLKNVITVGLDETPEGETPIVASYGVAGQWNLMSMPARGNLEAKLRVREQIREATVGQSFEQALGTGFVVGMMPSAAGVGTLAIGKNDDVNPLNLLLSMISTGGSNYFAVVTGDGEELEPSGEILVSFPNIESAAKYALRADKVCYSTILSCRDEALMVQEVYNNPLGVEYSLRIAQTIVNVLSVIIMVLALIVLFFTGLRLIAQSSKTIALYHAMGATRGEVCLVFMMYMLELCLMAAVFAIVVGLIGAVIVSMANRDALSMVVDLAFGASGVEIWLVGWNWQMLGYVGLMLIMAPICILLSMGQFSTKKLSKRLKA